MIRFVDYAIDIFPILKSKNAVKKAIKKGQLLIDGKQASTGVFIKKNQVIELLEENRQKKIFELKLDIIFEDEFIAIINKPAGISVSGNQFKTIENALPYNLKKSSQKDAYILPKPAHRLDNQTSGLLLIAKTATARTSLGNQFETNEILKFYNAVVIGKTPKKGNITFKVEGKDAETDFVLIKTKKSKKFNDLSLLQLSPKTGRTHQLRIHCKESGFPILGDKLYYKKNLLLKGKGLFLCATGISFRHPNSLKLLQFEILYPLKFEKTIEKEYRRWSIE